MRKILSLGILVGFVCTGVASGDDGSQPTASPAQGAGGSNRPGGREAPAAGSSTEAETARLLSAVRSALERNSQEIKALKERYDRDMEEQRKTVQAQQKQIETLKAQLQKQGAAPGPAGGPDRRDPEREQKRAELQQKQIEVLDREVKLLAEQLEKQAPIVEKAETQTAALESQAKQAAQRDRELANAQDAIVEHIDSQERNPPQLPAPLKQWFLPSGTNVTPLSIWNTLAVNYNVFQHRKGAGTFQFDEFTPFFLVQLNKWIFLSGEMVFTQGGVSLGQAQADLFLNNWLTADIGYFLAPIGFWNEALDPRWINKLPDVPLVMRQVIPDGLTITGLQFRGSKYLGRSPWKILYAAYATNGLGVPGAGKAADWADLGGVIGTTGGVNDAMAYGGRLGFWLPRRGINFGVSEFVNAPYTHQSGAVMSVWQPYFNYHYGNLDFRFEYGDNFMRTQPFIGNNIERRGLYTQVAYRNYASLHKHLQRLEYVFRFSDAEFRGINQAKLDPTTFSTPIAAPVTRNQYTLGLNYYFYASTIFKLAYEFNDEVHRDLRDNVYMMQFVTNF